MEIKNDHRLGAVLGPTVLIFAVLRFAASILGATTSATLLVFGLSAMAGELFNTFSFLDSMFLLYLLSIEFDKSNKKYNIFVTGLKQ